MRLLATRWRVPALVLSAGMLCGARQGEADGLLALIEQLPPCDQEWRASDGGEVELHPAVCELLARLDAGEVLSDAVWRRAFERAELVRLRPRWPVGEPFAVGVGRSRWLPGARITLTPRVAGWTAASSDSPASLLCGLADDLDRQRESYQALGRLDRGPCRLVLDVVVEQRDERPAMKPSRPRADGVSRGRAAGFLWRGELRFVVDGVASFTEALPTVDTVATTSPMRAALSVQARGYTSPASKTGLWVRVDPTALRRPSSTGVGYPLIVELRAGARVLGAARLHLTVTGRGESEPASAWLWLPRSDPTREPAVLSGLRLVVRGSAAAFDPRELLGDWDADVTWSGAFEAPLADLLRPSPPR